MRSVCEDDTVVHSLLLTSLRVRPQHILQFAVTGFNMLLTERLHLILQADNLQQEKPTYTANVGNKPALIGWAELRDVPPY